MTVAVATALCLVAIDLTVAMVLPMAVPGLALVHVTASLGAIVPERFGSLSPAFGQVSAPTPSVNGLRVGDRVVGQAIVQASLQTGIKVGLQVPFVRKAPGLARASSLVGGQKVGRISAGILDWPKTEAALVVGLVGRGVVGVNQGQDGQGENRFQNVFHVLPFWVSLFVERLVKIAKVRNC